MTHFLFHSKSRGFSFIGRVLAVVLVASLFLFHQAWAAPRQIFVCTSAGQSPAVQKAVREFAARGGKVPLFNALFLAKDADSGTQHGSEELLAPKAYDRAAHNHLVVVGLRSKDPLLEKIWGFMVSIDEGKRQAYSQGWGYLQGDIGWIECDRNPFLHSAKVKNAPEDTIVVKISGTTDEGVLAALRAFEQGQLSGFVVAGELQRPKTTILDMDPLASPPPVTLPPQIEIESKAAWLAGWMQTPAMKYRALLDATGFEPKRIWRAKYLPLQVLEEPPAVRWLAGVHSKAYGNAIDIIEFASPEEARAAVSKIVETPFYEKGRWIKDKYNEVKGAGPEPVWEAEQATDEVIAEPHWKVVFTSSGRFLLMSTLPIATTTAIGGILSHAPAASPVK